jgi:hypothetical protein
MGLTVKLQILKILIRFYNENIKNCRIEITYVITVCINENKLAGKQIPRIVILPFTVSS